MVASGPFPLTPLGTHLSHGEPVGALFSYFGKTGRCAALSGWRRRVSLMRNDVLDMGEKPERALGGLSPEVPFSLPHPARAGSVTSRLRMLTLASTHGRRPSPGASSGSTDCCWVEGPSSCVRSSDSSRCTQRVEVSLHLSLYTTLPRLAKFIETKWNQPGIRTASLFHWGEFFSLKPTFYFPPIILAFGFAVWAL